MGCQLQTDAIYSDLSNAFDVPDTISLRKLNSLGFSGGYVNWLRSCLTDRQLRVRVLGILSSRFQVLPDVPQGYVLEPMLLNTFINDLRNVTEYSRLLLIISKYIVSLIAPKIAI
jgi:hypothetical protein